MKTYLFPLFFISFAFLSCGKSESIIDLKANRTAPIPPPSIPRPIILQPAGDVEVCVSTLNDFYTKVWQLGNGPSQACPYYLSDQRNVKVTFTDGTSILCQKTILNAGGFAANGGAGLQDISCQTNGAGNFLTYMDLHYYVSMGAGIQSDATFPLYACSSNSPYAKTKIIFRRGTFLYTVFTSLNTYSFSLSGQSVTKTIYTIEFLT